MANITHYSIVFHLAHVLQSDNTFISCWSYINVHDLQDVFSSDHLISLHTGLKSTDRINLSNVYTSSTSPKGLSTTLSNISKTTNENLFATDHHICSTIDTINDWMFTTINIVKLWFGYWIIDINAGTQKFTLFMKFIETCNPSCCFLGDTLQVFR